VPDSAVVLQNERNLCYFNADAQITLLIRGTTVVLKIRLEAMMKWDQTSYKDFIHPYPKMPISDAMFKLSDAWYWFKYNAIFSYCKTSSIGLL
jgi:hypothetical protein